MKFHVAVTENALKALNARRKDERDREEDWIAARRKELILPGMSRRAAAAVRRDIRAQVARMRRTGEFGGTRDDIVTRAVREELRARGLDRKWPKPPEGEVEAPGRPWGTPPSTPMGDGGYTHRVSVNLPYSLGDTVRRAAYWTSKDAVDALQDWADRWGDGVNVTLREAERDGIPAELALMSAAGRPSAPQSALEIRDRLRAKVLTTGDLLRAAIDRATEASQPEIPEQT
ncbi:Ribbon-helix-helix protein CopG domain-containing protein OS=Streptomyces fumanus OX=67302 GN=GCM10018772_70490 PE=4 SV=1 [Streptomyces fumanus]